MTWEHRPADTPRMNAAEDLAVQLTVNRCVENGGKQPHEMVHFGEADRWAVVVNEGRKIERELAALKSALRELLEAPNGYGELHGCGATGSKALALERERRNCGGQAMSKELWIKAHEELIEEAMEADPTLEWSQAYTLTAAGAHQRMVDKIANMADEAKDRAKYER